MKIAYIGIDILYAAMEALLEAGCEILEVFTCETDNKTEFNRKVTKKAEELDIPCHFHKITKNDIKRLVKNGCEAIFCAGYYYKIPVSEELPMVNVHPSYLPMGRGAWPMPIAILKKMTQSGVTIHKIVEQLDAGDILLQEAFPLSEDEDLESMMRKIDITIHHLISKLMLDFEGIYSAAFVQKEGEYWQCPTEKDWTISSEMSDEKIECILRAFYGYECIWEETGKRYELIRGRLVKQHPAGKNFFCTKEGSFIVAEVIEELRYNGM